MPVLVFHSLDKWIYFGFLALLFLPSQQAYSQNLSFEGDVVLSKAGNPMVEFDLGMHPMREPTTVKLLLRNTLDRTFSISTVVVSCACTSAKLEKSTMNPMESIELVLTLNPIDIVSQAVIRNHLFLEEQKGKGIDVYFTVSVEGLLSFQSSTAIIEISAEDRAKQFIIPFQFSAPVSIDNLRAGGVGGLTGLNVFISTDESGAKLTCELDDNLFKNGGVGEIFIEDASQNKKATLSCIMTRTPPMRLMPSVLRFVENQEKRTFDATALVRIDKSFLHWSGETETSDESYVELALKPSVSGMKFDYTRVSKGLYRLRFAAERPAFEELREIELVAETTSHSLTLKCRVIAP